MAVAIRVRQEFQKRADRWAVTPAWTGTESLVRVLASPARAEVVHGHSITQMLRGSTEARFPHQGRRVSGGPPDADELLAQAERVMRGEWQVFDAPLSVLGTAPRWRDHPVSGVATPLRHFSNVPYVGDELGGDVKYLWELNRHAELLRLAQAYALTSEERFAARAVALLEDWMVCNPPMQGINWVSALEVSFRSIAWCWIWQLTSSSRAWTDQVTGHFLWTLAYAGQFIDRYDSIHHSPNTHLTGEGLGLLYVGSLFPELRRAARWRRRGIDILVSEVPHQFLADGFHFERSTGYHRYTVEFYLHALAIARSTGASWSNAFVEPLAQALNASADLRLPDGEWPVLGDEDGGSTARLWASQSGSQAPLLSLGAALLPDVKDLAGNDPRDHALAWWFGATPAAPATARAARSHALGSAGYYLARDSTVSPPWYCLVDAGPHGGEQTGHAHTDLGHLELHVGKASILCDPGCAVYASDTLRRNWYRSLSAHACLQIDGNPLATPRGVFGWAEVSPTPVVECQDDATMWSCRLSYRLPHDGTITHERQVAMVRGHGVVVIDRVLGTGAHDLCWHWPTGQVLDPTAHDAARQRVRIGPVDMTWSGIDGAESRLVDVRRSRTYGQEERCSAIEIEAQGVTLPVTMATIVQLTGHRMPEVEDGEENVRIAFAEAWVLRSTRGALPTLVAKARNTQLGALHRADSGGG